MSGIAETVPGIGQIEAEMEAPPLRPVLSVSSGEEAPTPAGPGNRSRNTLRVILATAWIAVAAGATAAGWSYYVTPMEDRPFAEGHALFAPTGLIGHSMGIVGAAFMLVGVGMYMARKRLSFMSGWGRLSVWLEVHIFLCTLGPFLVVLHTSFRVGGLVSIAFWSMIAVVASGVFGRFLYGHIPKSVHGQFRTLSAVEQNRAELERTLREAGVNVRLTPTGAHAEMRPGLLTAIVDAVRFDLTRRRREANVRLRLARLSVPATARDRLASLLLDEERIRHQISWLKPFQRLFRYWHVFHLPLALVMLLVLAVHIGVAIAFGYGWPL